MQGEERKGSLKIHSQLGAALKVPSLNPVNLMHLFESKNNSNDDFHSPHSGHSIPLFSLHKK